MASPAPKSTQDIEEVPLSIVGGTHYGRYPKISQEATWNMIVSDKFLVPYAGYANVLTLNPNSPGRGLYSSYRANQMFAVIGTIVYAISPNLTYVIVGTLYTNEGDVFIAENNNGEIAITDKSYIYVWNYVLGTFRSSNPASPNSFSFPFPGNPPGYISFQNGRLIVACIGSTNWALSGFNDATSWSSTNSAQVGSLQTKPDYIQAAVPMPSAGNNLLVFGRNVAELWQDVGAALFPYQRASTFDVDYGCINPSSIASLNNYIVWIAVNEQSGPVLMVAVGNQTKSISTDGIDFKLGNLTNPTNCTGFLFQQDGHLLYQFTFPDDNLTYAYDFNSELFFSISDENLNYHIARQVVYFNNTYFFVSLNGGNIYQFDTLFGDADYGNGVVKELPRIRITPPLRLATQRYFIGKSLGFTIEQGQPNIVTEVVVDGDIYEQLATESGISICTESGNFICTEDIVSQTPIATYGTSQAQVYLAISRDGGETFGNFWPHFMNPTGKRKRRFIFQRLGIVNDATFQLRFVGLIRFVCTDGIVETYQ